MVVSAGYIAPIAAIMAAISLTVQTVAGVFLKQSLPPIPPPPPTSADFNTPGPADQSAPQQPAPPPPPPYAHRTQDYDLNVTAPRVPRRRSAFVRVFWGFVAACLISAGSICFVYMGVTPRLHPADEAFSICFGTALCTFALFPIWMLLIPAGRGFWMGLIRPFIVSAGIALGALGGVMLGFEDELKLHDDEIIFSISLMICGPVFALFFFLLGFHPIQMTRSLFGSRTTGEAP
jgi:hypothetical protein